MENKTENTFFDDYSNLVSSISSLKKSSQSYGYNYTDLPSLLTEIMPKVKEHNFILIQTIKQSDGYISREIKEPFFKKLSKDTAEEHFGEKVINYETPCFVLHSELMHRSGKSIECNMPLYVDDIDPQSLGSAETYDRRYSIFAMLNIQTEDDDGLKASQNGKRNQAVQQAKEPLPENINDIATFLSRQANPKIYYSEIKESSNIPPELKKQLNKIMYPK